MNTIPNQKNLSWLIYGLKTSFIKKNNPGKSHAAIKIIDKQLNFLNQ